MLSNDAPKKVEKSLTAQQKKFLKEYAHSLCPKRAAIKAGYSQKVAQVQGFELLRREKYTRALSEIIERGADHLEISTAFIIRKYLQLVDYASGHGAESLADAPLRDRGEPKDPVLLLRALDGLCKQLDSAGLRDEREENSMLTKIIGLNQERI